MAIYSIDYSNKLVKRLNSVREQILNKERQVSTYRYYINETPEIPDYDFSETQKLLREIDTAIISIKHEIRKMNINERVDGNITADEAILELVFLNVSMEKLRRMANTTQKVTSTAMSGSNGSNIVECNYDITKADEEYNKVYNRVMELQDALNRFNILHQVKIDIDVEDLLNRAKI